MPNGRLDQIGQFYLDKIQLESEELEQYAKTLSSSMMAYIEMTGNKAKVNAELVVSQRLLFHAIKSYFYDCARFKHFHGFYESNKELNKFKQAAFLTKWLVKIKPIQAVKIGSSKVDINFSAKVNSMFAFEWSLNMVGVSSPTVSKNTSDRIAYNLQYREFSENIYTLLLESWDSAEKLMKTNKALAVQLEELSKGK